MNDIREAAEKLGFEYCEKCSLIWCDKMGMIETDCPRCFYVGACDIAGEELETLRDAYDELQSERDDLKDKLNQIERLF